MTSEKKLAKLIDELLEEYMGTKYKRTDDNSLPATTAESPSINDNIEAEMNNRLSKNFFNNKYSDKYNAESAKQLPPGLVWVKNNEIHVQGLPGQNTLPGITPTEDVNLYVNGKQVKNQVFVSEHDYIYVDFNNKEIPLDIKIRISKDGLAAFMSVKLQTLIRYSLQDQQPRQKIVLQTSTSTSKSFPLGLNDILAKIKEAGINYGVDYPAIQKFLAEPRDGEFVIARGVPPTPSRDDTMEVLFPEKIIEHEYSNADRVDFYTFKAVPSVDENTLLAVKHEGEMGQPGLSVTGKAISAREPQKIFPHAGKGVRIENNMVYSTTAGRPMVRRIKTVWLFYVEPYLIHHGNIDLSVGNQNFRGSIKVFGDVRDGMKVRAGGNIHISGTVDRATVMAMDSIWVGKCIGAMVQAGGYSHYISNSYQTLKELHENLESLSMAINILLKHAILKEYKTKLGLIFLLLIEKKISQNSGAFKKFRS